MGVDEELLVLLLRKVKANGQTVVLKRVLDFAKELQCGQPPLADKGSPVTDQAVLGPDVSVQGGPNVGNGVGVPGLKEDRRRQDGGHKADDDHGPASRRRPMQLNSEPGGPCAHCGVAASSAWRKGPPEKAALCNQCGSRFVQKGTLDGFMPYNRSKDSAARLAKQVQVATSDDETGKPESRARAEKSGDQGSPRSAGSLTTDGDKQDQHAKAGSVGATGTPSMKPSPGSGTEDRVAADASRKQAFPGQDASARNAALHSSAAPYSGVKEPEWMAVMLQLEDSPSVGGSSRELRELLVTAVYAAEKDPTARHMKIPEKLQATLDLVTNRSVIQARRMALNVLEEARVNLTRCVQCNAARLTFHKVVNPISFICGSSDCLYPQRHCGQPPDSASDWYYGPREFDHGDTAPAHMDGPSQKRGKSDEQPQERRKRGRPVGSSSRRPDSASAVKPVPHRDHISNEDDHAMRRWGPNGPDRMPGMGGHIPPGMSSSAAAFASAMAGGMPPAYGMGNPHPYLGSGKGGWQVPPFPPYGAGYRPDWREMAEEEHMRHMQQMAGAPG
mmetsp:Transcript_8803/g.25363  ORF Transcript_8803/g.25363 Transcript_8803/m.25363 type:complete len:559 (+) Transcript_8803:191-1867(+)